MVPQSDAEKDRDVVINIVVSSLAYLVIALPINWWLTHVSLVYMFPLLFINTAIVFAVAYVSSNWINRASRIAKLNKHESRLAGTTKPQRRYYSVKSQPKGFKILERTWIENQNYRRR